MPLHLLKLCVGAESVRDLEDWIEERLAEAARRGAAREHAHVTRMMPKRRDDLLAGGSIYWVIKGEVSARQPLRDVQAFTDADGIGRCRLVLDPAVVRVLPRHCRPFQGWRYLPANDAPADLGSGDGRWVEMPEALRRELRELGLM